MIALMKGSLIITYIIASTIRDDSLTIHIRRKTFKLVLTILLRFSAAFALCYELASTMQENFPLSWVLHTIVRPHTQIILSRSLRVHTFTCMHVHEMKALFCHITKSPFCCSSSSSNGSPLNIHMK